MRVMTALVLREMGSTYGQSPGGYLWAILQPMGVIVILSVGFSLLLRSTSLGTSFILFYATGFLPFDTYSSLAAKIIKALNYSRPLLAYPKVTWMDAILARFVLNTLTSLTVACIILTGILLVERNRTVLDLTYILQGFSMAAILGLGVGTLNCLLMGLSPVWAIIWSIVTRPLFIASAVLFIYEDLGATAQNVLWWNPLVHVTGLVRKGFYPIYEGSYISLQYGYGFGMICLFFGLLFMRSQYRTILER